MGLTCPRNPVSRWCTPARNGSDHGSVRHRESHSARRGPAAQDGLGRGASPQPADLGVGHQPALPVPDRQLLGSLSHHDHGAGVLHVQPGRAVHLPGSQARACCRRRLISVDRTRTGASSGLWRRRSGRAAVSQRQLKHLALLAGQLTGRLLCFRDRVRPEPGAGHTGARRWHPGPRFSPGRPGSSRPCPLPGPLRWCGVPSRRSSASGYHPLGGGNGARREHGLQPGDERARLVPRCPGPRWRRTWAAAEPGTPRWPGWAGRAGRT